MGVGDRSLRDKCPWLRGLLNSQTSPARDWPTGAATLPYTTFLRSYFGGTPWRMPRQTPELLSSSLSGALRGAGACLRPLSSLRPLAQQYPKTHPSMPPHTTSPASKCSTRDRPASGCWREPPSAPAGLAVGTELNGRYCGQPSQS